MALLTAAICLCMVITGVLSQDYSPDNAPEFDENPLDIYCEIHNLTQGRTYTFKQICGENFWVKVKGLSNASEASFPWNFEMKLMTDMDDSTAVLSNEFQIQKSELTSGDNITDIITKFYQENPQDRSYTIQKRKCNNRDGKGMMRLYSGSVEFSGTTSFKVLCDFSDDNLKLAVKSIHDDSYVSATSFPAMDVQVDWTTTPFSSMVTDTPLADLKVVVEGDVPQLDPDDTCIFAIAYLNDANEHTKVDGKEDGKSTEDQYHDQVKSPKNFPNITYHDILIGKPICLRYGNATTFDLLQGVRANPGLIHVCGNYTMVLEVDPFRTMHNEKDSSDNFVKFDFRFNCKVTKEENPPSDCEIVASGFGGGYMGAFDTRIFLHGSKVDHETINRYSKLFRQDDNTWEYLHGHHDDPGGLQRRGFGLVNVYNKYFLSEVSESTCHNLEDDAALQSAISQIEGLNEENLKPNADFPTISPNTNKAKMISDRLKTSYDYAQIKTDIENLFKDMPPPDADSGFLHNANYRSLMGAYDIIMSVADALLSGASEDDIRHYANFDMCMVSVGLEYLPYTFHIMQDPQYMLAGFYGLMDIVGNLTRATFSARYFYPEFTCLENMLTNLLDYFQKLDMGIYQDEDLKWMFNSDQVRDILNGGEKIANNECGLRINQCVKKLQSICHTLDPVGYIVEPVRENKDEICAASFLKNKAEKHYRLIGLPDIRDQMRSEDMSDHCRNDPFAPQKGPLVLYKIEEENNRQVVYKGVPSLDNKYLFWKKDSVCTCKKCDRDMKMKKK